MARSDVALVTATGRQTSVLGELANMKRRWAQVEEPRNRARAMERFVYGRLSNQRGAALESAINLRTALFAPPVQKNKIKNNLLAWVARTLGQGTTTLVYPSKATDVEIARADVANAFLDWQRQTQDMDAMQYRAMMLAGMHGMSAYLVTWDPDDGPHEERVPVMVTDPVLGIPMPMRDPTTGEVVYTIQAGNGAPCVEPISVFDFVTDGQPDVQKAGRWCMVRRWLDPDDATMRLRDAGIARDATAQPIQNRQAHGATFDAVEAYEVWWRPGKRSRFPDGYYAIIIDGDVCDATTFPYKHGRLPLIPLRVMDVEDDFYGATWVEDAVPQQQMLNQSLRVLAHRAEVAGQIRKLAYGPTHSDWDDSPDGDIDVGGADGLESVKFVVGPDIPVDMYQLPDRYEKGIDETSNASEVTTEGDAAAQTKNARLVYNATQIDQLKSAHTVKNSNEATVERDTQILELCRQFVSRQRLVAVVGEDGIVSADYFSGEEIGGTVRLEVASSTERSPAQRGADHETGAQQGFENLGDTTETRQTGLDQTADQGASRDKLMALVQQASSGQGVQADPSIPPELAIPDLRRMLAEVAGKGPQATMPIRALLQEYEELKQQGQQVGPPGGAPGQAPKPAAGQQAGQAPTNGPQPLVH